MYRVFSLGTQPRPVSSMLACRLLGAVGSADFVSALLHALNQDVVPVDLISVFLFSNDWEPIFLGTDSTRELGKAKVAARHYIGGCFSYDPNLEILRDGKAGHAVGSYMPRNAVPSSAYRHNCYEVAGIIDRFSVMTRTRRGTAMTISLYRSEENQPMTEGELARLADHASLVIEACLKHVELVGSGRQDFEDFLQASLERYPFLSRREREVCAGLLAGLSQDEIAKRLGIKKSSVISHRKRAYQRLGVKDQCDLLRHWYMPATARTADGGGDTA